MAEIKLKTDRSEQAIVILREAMKTEELRIKYVLDVAQKSLQNLKRNMESLLKPLLMNGQPKIWTEGIWSMLESILMQDIKLKR